jgi:UDP-N-acetyl-2-amino-2-deoxyglucuronate dehydrogenase
LKTTFGFGIIGAGTISDIHASAIRAIPRARLLGVYSITSQKSRAFAARHGCISYDSLEEMLDVPAIDIVCICTPSGMHLEPAVKSLKAGKHCIIEKPLEITLQKCDELIQVAEQLQVMVAVVFPSRFYEPAKQLRRAIEENRFGNLVLGDAYVKWSRSAGYYQSAAWRGTWELDGGGALMNQGIHSVDLLQWYMGPVHSVQAVAANIRHKNIEVEDTIVSTVKYANGALGTIVCSTAVHPGALKQVEIMGTKGTAILQESSLIKWQFEQQSPEDDVIANQMTMAVNSHGGVSNPADISYAGHQKQIEDMIEAVDTGRKPLIDAREGRKSVEIVTSIYESAKSGKMVTLPGDTGQPDLKLFNQQAGEDDGT